MSEEAIFSLRSIEEYDAVVESVNELLSEQGYHLVEGLGIIELIKMQWIHSHTEEVDE